MLEIKLNSSQAVFMPGDAIGGVVTFGDLPESDNGLSIRLIWYTSGKGDRDYRTVQSVECDLVNAPAKLPFEFTTPHRPLSFSGKLIALQWAVEVVALPSKNSSRADLAVATNGKLIQLQEVSKEQKKSLGLKNPFVRSRSY